MAGGALLLLFPLPIGTAVVTGMDVTVPPGTAVKGAGVIPGGKLPPRNGEGGAVVVLRPGGTVAGADDDVENPGAEEDDCALQQNCPNCTLVLESHRDALSKDVT